MDQSICLWSGCSWTEDGRRTDGGRTEDEDTGQKRNQDFQPTASEARRQIWCQSQVAFIRPHRTEAVCMRQVSPVVSEKLLALCQDDDTQLPLNDGRGEPGGFGFNGRKSQLRSLRSLRRAALTSSGLGSSACTLQRPLRFSVAS
ncbi:unnamed protein product [Pleuronectes platessa]|uniref:Uncharacterized protein n=1 Tax=Pleuronectes platessa TaxID=8262 RepID=A0A9N7VQT3_PLEPL|nr:unnamed protein product [Pleuronectes platessa]